MFYNTISYTLDFSSAGFDGKVLFTVIPSAYVIKEIDDILIKIPKIKFDQLFVQNTLWL